ncbi:hypothetical protein LG296_07340 [Ureibacillus chungkukjangi]|uniref:hypothetical protein n=1 Tax=Ureibacillus chungkukjangi TaxID=1202712 RepID=UPI00384C2FE9
MLRIILVNYLIDDKLSTLPTKALTERTIDGELEIIQYEVFLENQHVISKISNVTELGVKNFQKALPKNIRIAACQTCRYGNFSPYGDNDNEIFCLIDFDFKNKSEVCEIFSDASNLEKRRQHLLDFCSNYKPISLADYYTYNDWHWD